MKACPNTERGRRRSGNRSNLETSYKEVHQKVETSGWKVIRSIERTIVRSIERSITMAKRVIKQQKRI